MSDTLANVNRYDVASVDKATITDEGYLKANAVVSRTGVFKYMNSDGTIRKELRHPDDVFESESLDTLKMRPITNGHPQERLVNADNARNLTVGYAGEQVNLDGQYIVMPLMVTDKSSVDDVQSGTKQELSLGYTVDLVREDGKYNGQEYTHRQTNIRYNHVAIVDRARAGPEARIHLDANDAQAVIAVDDDYYNVQPKKESEMSDEKLSTVTLDGIDYKSAPEVVNAYKKTNEEKEQYKANLDSLNSELEKLKAEKDSLQEKYDEAINVDHEAKINEAVKARVNLINSTEKLLGNEAQDLNLDNMSNYEIMSSVVSKKCPKANLDSVSEDYVKARFDGLVEDYEEQGSEALAKQREQVTPKMDANNDAKKSPRDRMIEQMRNAYKDAGKKHNK